MRGRTADGGGGRKLPAYPVCSNVFLSLYTTASVTATASATAAASATATAAAARPSSGRAATAPQGHARRGFFAGGAARAASKTPPSSGEAPGGIAAGGTATPALRAS